MTVTLEPIHKARCGRLALAILCGEIAQAETVVAEAITDDTLPELLDAVLGALVGHLRLAFGDDGARQWASDWILHARMAENPE